MKVLGSLIALVTFSLSLHAAAKYPFPQNVKYPFGIKPATIDAAKVQKAFEDFMKLYEESGDKTMARIMHDTKANTVSEGIGYGMMILVYMDNTTNNTQAKFDKLWKYYNNFLDPKGLMNWKIVGFSGPPSGFEGKNSATDAELDVAAALLEAYKQWGDEKYLTDAKAFIAKIAKEEVNVNGFLKPGDTWDSEKNPSYFSTAALQLYKNASDFDWNKVVTNSYTLVKKSQNATTGLIPNWCSEQGVPTSPSNEQNYWRGDYTYDATRTPWRLAWAYLWYGHQDAKDICTKLATWISTKTAGDPEKIVNGYKLDGTEIEDYNNSTFVGPFGCAGMVDATHQAWVDKCFEYLPTIPETVYYQISMKILTMLLLSGNMPDFWTATSVNPWNNLSKPVASSLSLSFNSSTTSELTFSTANAGHVKIYFYTISGKLVAMPVDGAYSAGNNRVSLNQVLNPGTYIIRLRTPNGELTQQTMITR